MKIINLLAYSKTGFEQNIGDAFAALALKKYLKQKKDRWVTAFFNRSRVDLRPYDLVVLGGGGLYHPDHLKSLEKNTNLFSSPTPLAIVGVGLNLDGRQKFNSQDNRRLKRLVEVSFLNTVRDQWSFNYLKWLGLQTKITGCPSLFLPDRVNLQSKKTYDLGINLATSHARFYLQKSGQTLRLVDRVVKKLGGEKIVICHAKKEKRLFQKIFPKVRVFYSSRPQKVFSVYRCCRLVLGMRGHSQIFSLAVGTPSLAIPLNEKVAQPVKMTLKNYRPLIVSLDESLASVAKKIATARKNAPQIKNQQASLVKKLKINFLQSIKLIDEHCRLS